MKKKLYYVVEPHLQNVDGEIMETDGNKTITVYEMVDNEPKEFATIEGDLTDESEELIQDYLDDNGHGDESFEFKIL